MTTFIQQEKKQKILIFIFIASVLIIFFVLWYGFRQKTTFLPLKKPVVTFQTQEIKIDWQMFEDENSVFRKLEKKLQPFKRIKEFDGDFGRINPFIPY